MINIEFTEDDYRENEDGDMEITVARNQDITLANPVIVRITPLTVEEALDRGIITTFDEDETFSPNRAGNNDNVLIITLIHLVLSTCSIALVEAAKQKKNIVVGRIDNTIGVGDKVLYVTESIIMRVLYELTCTIDKRI